MLGLSANDEARLIAYMSAQGWKEVEDNYIFVGNQEENIKTKNITEKIELENVASVIAAYR